MRNMIKMLIGTTIFLGCFKVFAYNDDKKNELCRNPKVQEFNLPEYGENSKTEVPPQAAFSFVVSGWADPKNIKITGKNKPIPFEVESNDSFHRIKGKIPAELTGQYVRMNVRIPAVLGCYTLQGWLLKIAGNSQASSAAPAPAKTETAPAKADANTAAAVAPANASSEVATESKPNKPTEANEAATKSAAPVTNTVETKPATTKATAESPVKVPCHEGHTEDSSKKEATTTPKSE